VDTHEDDDIDAVDANDLELFLFLKKKLKSLLPQWVVHGSGRRPDNMSARMEVLLHCTRSREVPALLEPLRLGRWLTGLSLTLNTWV
jgi:hypothetical protein